eukprot:g25260.t1
MAPPQPGVSGEQGGGPRLTSPAWIHRLDLGFRPAARPGCLKEQKCWHKGQQCRMGNRGLPWPSNKVASSSLLWRAPPNLAVYFSRGFRLSVPVAWQSPYCSSDAAWPAVFIQLYT